MSGKYEITIGYLEDIKKPIIIRRNVLNDPTIKNEHISEIEELDKQLNELNDVIEFLGQF